MKIFKSISDVERAVGHSAHSAIEKLVVPYITEYPEYRPEDDGYLVLIEPADVDRVLSDLDMPWNLSEVPFEAVERIDEFFHAFYLANNQFGIGFLIPDAAWVTGELRRVLEDNLDP